jgi:hypothetical protein
MYHQTSHRDETQSSMHDNKINKASRRSRRTLVVHWNFTKPKVGTEFDPALIILAEPLVV